jgi:hypothetical protein
VDAAWTDLNAVDKDDPSYAVVQLERIVVGIEAGDTAQTAAAFEAMLLRDDARQWVDTLSGLALKAVSTFGAARTREMLSTPLPEWVAAARDSVSLLRARLALHDGDTATAWAELNQLASQSATAIANAARVALARSRLETADELQDLRAMRPILLPAISDPNAQALIRSMAMVDVLTSKAQNEGQLVALFAAAEIARDDLGAHKLARKLFITFADVAPQTPWAPKALLAALALAPDADDAPVLRDRLLQYSTSPYVMATEDGAVAEAFESAEERLQRSLIILREEGAALAQQQDLSVTRVVATLDSLRIVARMDSTRLSCGLMIDTLAVKGIRADSVRGACMRSDTLKVAEYLKIDTLRWKRAQPGTQPKPPIKPDTIR